MAALVATSIPTIHISEVVKFAHLAVKSYEESSYELVSGDSCVYEIESNPDNSSKPVLQIAFKGSHTAEQWLLNSLSPSALVSGRSSSDVSSIETRLNSALVRALIDNIRDGIYAEEVSKKDSTTKKDSTDPAEFDLFSRYEFVLCGHSRGGQLASTAALYLIEKGAFVKAVYTYGAPKLYSGYNVNAPQLASLRALLVSVIHKGDPVPCALDVLANRYSLGEGTTGDVTIRLQNTASRAPPSAGSKSFFSALVSAAADAVMGCHSMKYCYVPGCEQLLQEMFDTYGDDGIMVDRSVPAAVAIDTSVEQAAGARTAVASASHTINNVPPNAAAEAVDCTSDDINNDEQRRASKILSGQTATAAAPSAPMLSSATAAPSALSDDSSSSYNVTYATATPVSENMSSYNSCSSAAPMVVEAAAFEDAQTTNVGSKGTTASAKSNDNVWGEVAQSAFQYLMTKSPATSTKSAPAASTAATAGEATTKSANLRGSSSVRSAPEGNTSATAESSSSSSDIGIANAQLAFKAAGAAFSLYKVASAAYAKNVKESTDAATASSNGKDSSK